MTGSNLAVSSNTISASNTNGSISLTPNGTGSLNNSRSLNGSTNTIYVRNTSNTANSHASMIVWNGGTSGGDVWYQLLQEGGNQYSLGINNSNGNLTINNGSQPSSATLLMNITSTGQITTPLNPSFFAYLATSDTNATGNGAVYTLGGTTALTETFDRGSNFNPTGGVFTASTTGLYYFCVSIGLSNITAGNSCNINLVASGITYRLVTFNPVNFKNTGSGNASVSASMFITMTAADTAVVQVTNTGEAANTNTILGSATRVSFFSGYLVG